MQSIGGEQGGGYRQQARNLPAAQGVLAEHLEHVGQQRDARAEQRQPDDIQRIVLRSAIIRQMPVHQDQAGHANRNVDEENDAPMEIADDQPAHQRPEHRAD
jgi:hypothetical protein